MKYDPSYLRRRPELTRLLIAFTLNRLRQNLAHAACCRHRSYICVIYHMDKIINVISGLNGSGKTTFAETYLVSSTPSMAYLTPIRFLRG